MIPVDITKKIKDAMDRVASNYPTGATQYYESQKPDKLRSAMDDLNSALESKNIRRIETTLIWWEKACLDLFLDYRVWKSEDEQMSAFELDLKTVMDRHQGKMQQPLRFEDKKEEW